MVGHTRDKRSRELLCLPGEVRDGVLRHLVTNGERVAYAHGTPPRTSPDEAVLIFTDGGMRESPLEAYELFDLDTRTAARRAVAHFAFSSVSFFSRDSTCRGDTWASGRDFA